MTVSEQYRRQVGLLVQVLPFIAEEPCFALKGGTAINLFVRNLPRLSVDIDLTYLPVADRKKSLDDISAALQRIAARISARLPQSRVHAGWLQQENAVNKLVIRMQGVQVKIEVTPVLRGCVYAPETRAVSSRVEEEFGFATIQVVSFADLYAGKIVAALDRQHPRDLFDVRDLLANEGIDEKLRNAFIVYLLSHNRPMAEVLAPTRRDIAQEFERGFIGMAETTATLEELNDVREQLIVDIVGNMPQSHRELLISFKSGQPDWSLIDVPNAQHLPAIRWRRENLAKLDENRRTTLLDNLKAVLAKA
jgi:predicted nucleotidyltransferase component of viral defense system